MKDFLPLLAETEVLVVGGGPAGFASALASARLGCKTLLIDEQGFIGGMATAGLVGPFMWTKGMSGIFSELLSRLQEKGFAKGLAFDAEALKIEMQTMLEEAGVNLLLHTFACDALLEGDRLRGVEVANKAGKGAILAQVTIDATGDGDIAFFAGCPFQKGREDGWLQAVTLFFRVGGIDEERVPKDREFLQEATRKAVEAGEIDLPGTRHNQGIVPLPYKGSTIREGEGSVNIDMATGIDGTDPWDLTKAELIGRRKAWEVWRFYKKYIPGFENSYIIDTAPRIGIRETRRILGDYILTGEDVRAGRKFEDVIAICSYPIDLHDIDGGGEEWYRNAPPSGDHYDIPYRCLLPKGVEGLLVAGRCISSDREAQGSLRIMPTCMAIGQSAGCAGALAVKEGCTPREVNVKTLQEVLRRQGVDLGR